MVGDQIRTLAVDTKRLKEIRMSDPKATHTAGSAIAHKSVSATRGGVFSRHNSDLQIVWDSTSLKELCECPRGYQLHILEGWRKPNNYHLDFGSLFASATECFHKARLRGASKEAATLEALKRTVQASGSYEEERSYLGEWWPFTFLWQPWGGAYEQQWRCTGTEPYSVKGRKCPFSHARKWFDLSRPGNAGQGWAWQGEAGCPECSSPIEKRSSYQPDHPTKHRLNLLRLVIDFCDAQEPGGFEPYAFPDGTEGVELQLRVPLGRKVPPHDIAGIEQEDYELVANLDLLATFQGRHYVVDEKTTEKSLSEWYFNQYRVNTQTGLYDLILHIAGSPIDVGGVAIRAWQVTRDGPAGSRTILLTKTEGQREEALRDLHAWIDFAEKCAAEGYWPMNRTCACPHPEICDMDPAFRREHLAADYVQRYWSPIMRENKKEPS